MTFLALLLPTSPSLTWFGAAVGAGRALLSWGICPDPPGSKGGTQDVQPPGGEGMDMRNHSHYELRIWGPPSLQETTLLSLSLFLYSSHCTGTAGGSQTLGHPQRDLWNLIWYPALLKRHPLLPLL